VTKKILDVLKIKRIIVCCLLLTMVFSACSSKGNKDYANVVVEGCEVNLSDDFPKTVSTLYQEGIYVPTLTVVQICPYISRYFGEDGRIKKAEEGEKIETIVWGDNVSVIGRYNLDKNLWHGSTANGTFAHKHFSFYGETNFSTKDGINNKSKESDIENLKGYVPFNYRTSNTSRAVLYVDGKIVDLNKYQAEYEAWIEAVNKKGYLEAMKEQFPDLEYSYISLRPMLYDWFLGYENYEQLHKSCENNNIHEKEIILLAFAMKDAGGKMASGKVDSYTLMIYEYFDEDKGMTMDYYEFYFDDNYDEERYSTDIY